MKNDQIVAFVTGANRGLGKRFAAQLVERGAKVYAAARRPETIDVPGVVPAQLDVTDPESVARAASVAGDVNVLINNAGVSTGASLLTGPMDDVPGGLPQHLDVGPDTLDPRRPDEHRVHRTVEPLNAMSSSNESTWRPKALRRTVISIPLSGDGLAPGGARVQDLGGQQDHARTRPVGRHAVGQPRPQRFEQFELAQQMAHRRGLPAGDDQRVDGIEFAAAAAPSTPRRPPRAVPPDVRGCRPAVPVRRRAEHSRRGEVALVAGQPFLHDRRDHLAGTGCRSCPASARDRRTPTATTGRTAAIRRRGTAA